MTDTTFFHVNSNFICETSFINKSGPFFYLSVSAWRIFLIHKRVSTLPIWVSHFIFLAIEHLRSTLLLHYSLFVEIRRFLWHIYNIILSDFLLLDVLRLVSCITEKVIELLFGHVITLWSCTSTISVLASLIEIRVVPPVPRSWTVAECLSKPKVLI